MRIRRERFFKMNDWQQIKRIEENVFSLEIGRVGRWWSIKLSTIPTALDTRYKTIIEQFTDRHIGSLFNALPYDLWNKTIFLKYDDVWKHLDIWLESYRNLLKLIAMEKQSWQNQTILFSKLRPNGDPIFG